MESNIDGIADKVVPPPGVKVNDVKGGLLLLGKSMMIGRRFLADMDAVLPSVSTHRESKPGRQISGKRRKASRFK